MGGKVLSHWSNTVLLFTMILLCTGCGYRLQDLDRLAEEEEEEPEPVVQVDASSSDSSVTVLFPAKDKLIIANSSSTTPIEIIIDELAQTADRGWDYNVDGDDLIVFTQSETGNLLRFEVENYQDPINAFVSGVTETGMSGVVDLEYFKTVAVDEGLDKLIYFDKSPVDDTARLKRMNYNGNFKVTLATDVSDTTPVHVEYNDANQEIVFSSENTLFRYTDDGNFVASYNIFALTGVENPTGFSIDGNNYFIANNSITGPGVVVFNSENSLSSTLKLHSGTELYSSAQYFAESDLLIYASYEGTTSRVVARDTQTGEELTMFEGSFTGSNPLHPRVIQVASE